MEPGRRWESSPAVLALARLSRPRRGRRTGSAQRRARAKNAGIGARQEKRRGPTFQPGASFPSPVWPLAFGRIVSQARSLSYRPQQASILLCPSTPGAQPPPERPKPPAARPLTRPQPAPPLPSRDCSLPGAQAGSRCAAFRGQRPCRRGGKESGFLPSRRPGERHGCGPPPLPSLPPSHPPLPETHRTPNPGQRSPVPPPPTLESCIGLHGSKSQS